MVIRSSVTSLKRKAIFGASKTALGYIVVAALWILLSDMALEAAVGKEQAQELQTYKGWFFVLVTGLLLFIFVRRQLRVAQREWEAHELAIHGSGAGYWNINPKTHVAFLSSRFQSMLGLALQPEGNSGEQEWLSVVTNADRPEVQRAITEACTTGSPVDVAFEAKVHGESRWFILRGEALQCSDKSVDGVAGSLVDVTEMHHLQRQILQSQKLDAVGRLASGMAHDFNNLLSVMLGYGELIRDQASDEAMRRAAGRILDAVERGTMLTRHMLSMVRNERVQIRSIDLNALVHQAADMADRLMPSGTRVFVDAPSYPVWAAGNETLLHQVLLNLLTNARDATTSSKGIEVTVSTRDFTLKEEWRVGEILPGPYAIIRVKDSGSGIAEAELARIFDPFYTTKPEGKGTGLGLPMVASIIKSHDGAIGVESKVGVGTVVSLAIPLAESEPFETATTKVGDPITARREAKRKLLSGSIRRVLLVDDEEGVREFMATAISGLDLVVSTASNGSQALAMLEKNTYVLVICDRNMPGMDGLSILQAMREQGIETPFVLMSGQIADESDVWPKPDAVMQKPFTLQELHLVTQGLLEASKTGG